MICAFNDDEKKDILIRYIDAFNNNSSFLIIRFYKFSFFIFIWANNNYKNNNYIYYKTGFIIIVKIFNLNSIFVHYNARQSKLIKNHDRIFV